MIADSPGYALIECLSGFAYHFADYVSLLSPHYAKRELSFARAARDSVTLGHGFVLRVQKKFSKI